ncbi:MAG: LON peptidase substrate-binding domain-containing protein, partial [Clostridiaceae bacterium]
MEKHIKNLPLIPLRGLTIFPYMVLHFDVGREKSIDALEEAMVKDQEIFLVSQKDAKIEEPEKEDIFSIGTLCSVKQILKLPGDTVRVLVEGQNRAELLNFTKKEPYLEAEIKILEEDECSDKKKCEALVRMVKSDFDEYIKLSGNIPAEALITIDDFEEPGRMADLISSYILIKQNNKQELLEASDVVLRLEKLDAILVNEIEILRLEKKLGIKVKNKIDKG